LIRGGGWRRPTAELAAGFVQANLVIVTAALADRFEQFCRLNSQPLPLLERICVGSPYPRLCARSADLRTDLPNYRVIESGCITGEPANLRQEWQDDWCAFLLGCSFTFDSLLTDAGIPVRHLEQGCNVPMYATNRFLNAVAPFSGNLVVSMRPVPLDAVEHVIRLTQPLENAHGGPLHVGDPGELGIRDLDNPDYGDAVTVRAGEVPVFWACGVTAQQVAQSSRIPLMVTHAPGHMFITDWRIQDLTAGANGFGSPRAL
jgi:uncharacterized protein YcsI (UPF0317 family)